MPRLFELGMIYALEQVVNNRKIHLWLLSALSSCSISSIVGSAVWISAGRLAVRSYVETPMGLLMSRRAYSARMRFLDMNDKCAFNFPLVCGCAQTEEIEVIWIFKDVQS